MAEEKIRVVVVDDHMITRDYLEMSVRASNRYALTASFPTASEAVRYAGTHAFDLLVMDVLMKTGVDGLTAAEIIKRTRPQIRIVLITSTAEASWLSRAREIGVESFWYKEYGTRPLLEIMDRTMAGESVYLDESSDIAFGNIKRGDLTARELDVLRELVAGATNQEIAGALCVSVNTVKAHIQNMLDKTGFSNRLELAIQASRLGLVVNDRELYKQERK